MLNLLETIFIWGVYLGLPVMLMIYHFGAKNTAFGIGLSVAVKDYKKSFPK